jgi:hypothetical protein
VVLGLTAPAVDVLIESGPRCFRLVTTMRVSRPCAPTSTRGMMGSTRLILAHFRPGNRDHQMNLKAPDEDLRNRQAKGRCNELTMVGGCRAMGTQSTTGSPNVWPLR